MKFSPLLGVVLLLCPTIAQAHFIWLVPSASKSSTIQVIFGDTLAPDKIYGKRLANIAGTKFWLRNNAGKVSPLQLHEGSDDHGILKATGKGYRVVGGKCIWGVHILKERNEKTPFLIYYYPKLILDHDSNTDLSKTWKRLVAEIVPRVDKETLHLKVLFKGQPVPRTEIHVLYPDGKRGAYRTKTRGTLKLPMRGPGTYALWARCAVEPKAGKHGDRRYDEIRHYATLIFTVPAPK